MKKFKVGDRVTHNNPAPTPNEQSTASITYHPLTLILTVNT